MNDLTFGSAKNEETKVHTIVKVVDKVKFETESEAIKNDRMMEVSVSNLSPWGKYP